MKYLIAALLLAFNVHAADYGAELSAAVLGSQGEQMSKGQEYKLALKRDNWNVWISHSEQGQIMTTQSPGDLAVLGLGLGYEENITDRVSLGFDVGYGKVSEDYNQRIFREAVYFSFVPIYGHPTHITDPGGYMNTYLKFTTKFTTTPIIRVNLKYELNDYANVFVGYRYFRPKQFVRFYNEDMGFDPSDASACDCAWEGHHMVDMSAFTAGFSIKF